MFHLSTDRLAGLDTTILKITTPPKLPRIILNHTSHHDTVKKQNPHRETRTPLADKTVSNSLPPRPTNPIVLHSLSTPGEFSLPPLVDASFCPLPPLPPASNLQLPSFLNLSSRSFVSHVGLPLASPPASALFHVSSPPVTSSRAIALETKQNTAFEGPQWIPAFHHPNSPYVPWPSPVRRRILLPPSLPPSPACPSPCIRTGAIAPEPWSSSIFSRAHDRSARERLSSSWQSFKNTIKKGVKTVVARLGHPRVLCVSKDVLCNYDDNSGTSTGWPNLPSDAVEAHGSDPRDAFASFISSDSATLAAWLAERRANASCVIDNTPKEMSVEEYELVGSWLDLRPSDGGWRCGVQDCDMHTAGGSPHVASRYPNGLRMAMPFDNADLLSPVVPCEPFSEPRWFHSLPRLPCQSFDIHPAQATPKNAEQCLTRVRELSMPGGWTF